MGWGCLIADCGLWMFDVGWRMWNVDCGLGIGDWGLGIEDCGCLMLDGGCGMWIADWGLRIGDCQVHNKKGTLNLEFIFRLITFNHNQVLLP